ncbi:uncharacterized protein [Leptinotarsa decemlineata]|uniref:uncharacterized protein n=1 Tax=Leptinotarsa decemlineata TaxID=7539 RepID=UPI003D30A602
MDTMDFKICEKRLEGKWDDDEANSPSNKDTVKVKIEDGIHVYKYDTENRVEVKSEFDIDIVYEELGKDIFETKEQEYNCRDIFDERLSGPTGFFGYDMSDCERKDWHSSIRGEDSQPFVKQGLNRLIVQKKNQVKKFHCAVCSKSFIQKHHLTRHFNTHSAEKLFRCDVCSKSFSRKDYLSVHSRSHSGEGLFNCENCSKSFTCKNHLTRHSMIHSGERPFQCAVCSKSFIDKGHLTVHFKTHSGEKSFRCDVCSKSFTRKYHLVRHLMIHSGEKPFNCGHCSKSFITKYKLSRHEGTHVQLNCFLF